MRSRDIVKLAFDTILIRSDPRMNINWDLLRRRLEEFYERKNLVATVCMVEVLTDAPYILRKVYKEPCLSCLLHNLANGVLGIGEELGYCDDCMKDNVPVTECRLLNKKGGAYCCQECCSEMCLLK